MAIKSRIAEVKAELTRRADLLSFRLAHQLRNNAIEAIQSGQKSGRIYKRGAITHQASAPGEAPASDTGALVRSIRVDHQPGTGRASVVVAADYAGYLEFGTRKMAPRPFIRPSIAKLKAEAPEVLRTVKFSVKKS